MSDSDTDVKAVEGTSSAGGQPSLYPIMMEYCPACTMPAEYCEFSSKLSACKPWLQKKFPEIYLSVLTPEEKAAAEAAAAGGDEEGGSKKKKSSKKESKKDSKKESKKDSKKKKSKKHDSDEEEEEQAAAQEQDDGSSEEEEAAAAPAPAAAAAGGKKKVAFKGANDDEDDGDAGDNDDAEEDVKDMTPEEAEAAAELAARKQRAAVKKGKGTGATGNARILIAVKERKPRKYMTVIMGVEEFGLTPKEAAKGLAKRISCGSTITESTSGRQCVELQGDRTELVPRFLVELWSIPEDKIFIVDGAKAVPAFS